MQKCYERAGCWEPRLSAATAARWPGPSGKVATTAASLLMAFNSPGSISWTPAGFGNIL